MLEQIALSFVGKKLIAIAAGGALAASAAVYSQGDMSGEIGAVGYEESLRPIAAEIDFRSLLSSADGNASADIGTTAIIEGVTLGDAQTDASVRSEVQLDATMPLDVTFAIPSADAAVSSEAGASTAASVALAEEAADAEVSTESRVGVDASADAEVGVASLTADLVSQVDGDLGIGVLIQ